MNEIRVGMTGGGTGGHIYPLIAVSQKLQELAGERGLAARIRYFGKSRLIRRRFFRQRRGDFFRCFIKIETLFFSGQRFGISEIYRRFF